MQALYLPTFRPDALAFFRAKIFALKKARASGRNVGKVFNPVLKLVFENYPFSCLSQLRSPHFKPFTESNNKLTSDRDVVSYYKHELVRDNGE